MASNDHAWHSKTLPIDQVLLTFMDPAQVLETILMKLRHEYKEATGEAPQFVEVRVFGILGTEGESGD